MSSARAYYNEFDPGAAAWLRELIYVGVIAPGDVDERSIADVRAVDLEGYTQVHFFAGIGGWSHALRLAGWPDDRPVWTGSCPCFPAGTLILTQRGQVPIETVVVGDVVLTHKARWRRVTATGSDPGRAVVRVRGQGHPGLVCTPNHPFLTGDDEWTPAADLKGKRWRTVAHVPSFGPPPLWTSTRGVRYVAGAWRATGWRDGKTVYIGRYATQDKALAARQSAMRAGHIDVRGANGAQVQSLGFARFMGYWLGDGWTSRGNVVICGSREDAPLLNDIMTGAGLCCTLTQERTSSRARCGSTELADWLRQQFGTASHSKRIPVWLHSMPVEYRDAFMSGYAEADGCTQPNGQSFTTVSHALAIGTRILLNQAGRSVSVSRHLARGGQAVIEGRVVHERPMYGVKAFTRAKSFEFTDIHGIGLVRHVEPAGTATVYNLSVDEDESYCADGIVVHNCQSLSNAGKRGMRVSDWTDLRAMNRERVTDDKHLWPDFYRLLAECRPAVAFGEQTASADGRTWLAAVRADLEDLGYAVGAADLSAAGVGAPHIRQRLWWGAKWRGSGGRGGLADPDCDTRISRDAVVRGVGQGDRAGCTAEPERRGLSAGRLADAGCGELRSCGPRQAGSASSGSEEADGERERFRADAGAGGTPAGGLGNSNSGRRGEGDTVSRCAAASISVSSSPCGLGNTDGVRLEGRDGGRDSTDERAAGEASVVGADRTARTTGWEDPEWLPCRDGKWRPTQPGLSPLAHGVPARTLRLRGYGNAIVPQVGAAFIEAFEDAVDDLVRDRG